MNTPRWITISTSIFPLKNLYNYCYNISIYGYNLNIPNYFNSLSIVLLLFYFNFPLFIFLEVLVFNCYLVLLRLLFLCKNSVFRILKIPFLGFYAFLLPSAVENSVSRILFSFIAVPLSEILFPGFYPLLLRVYKKVEIKSLLLQIYALLTCLVLSSLNMHSIVLYIIDVVLHLYSLIV